MRALAVLLALALAVGCAGGGDGRLETADLPRLVLQPDDVPGGLDRFDEGRLARADMGTGERGDHARFGREGGWKARYRLPDAPPGSEGPLVLESRVDLFPDAGAADRDLELYRAELEGAWRPLEAAGVGEESLAYGFVQQALEEDVVSFTIAWRQRNVTASVSAQGYGERFALEDLVALAQAQARRIERVAAE